MYTVFTKPDFKSQDKSEAKSQAKYDDKSQEKGDSKSQEKGDSKSQAKYDDKSDAKSDVDGLDNITDWAIRYNFDNNKSINRIAEDFFNFNQKEAWDNITRINGLQKANENKNRNVKREGVFGLKDATDYDKVQEDIFNPFDKLKQTTMNLNHDTQPKNAAAKQVLVDIPGLNSIIEGHFGGRNRSKKSRKRIRKSKKRTRKIVKKNKTRKIKKNCKCKKVY